MQPWNHILRVGLAGLLLVALTGGGWAAEDTREETKQARHDLSWWEHYRPVEATPETQLAWINKLKDAGHTIRASKACLALVNAWPESPQAPVAQLTYCRLLEQRGKPAKAFEEYQFLVEAYAGFFPYDEVMDSMYAIADGISTRDRYFLFIKFKTPEEAIPLFEKLIRNGTQWKRAAELQFRIARIYEKTQQYDLAVEAYGTYHQRYPMSPLAEQALFSQGRCCYEYSRENPVALDLRENAAAVLQGCLDWYPYSDMAAEARTCLADLQHALVGGLYGQAALYQKTARFTSDKRAHQANLVAARVCYERVIDEFPHSEWAEQAHVRIAEINQQRGKDP
ncbi:MAG: tetratricopeptide repeat protein [Kiritimatiellae bacterium]|nr:tetratricopeptide repeat protein [Verrucomicrobiota bacterium]MBU4366225.1 tetratricopeptide repeat protein [Verrucomicrobiota bacterium]MCG2659881.1 tetratricopeptide repeat protein [Kiritimatiellia bacterium]